MKALKVKNSLSVGIVTSLFISCDLKRGINIAPISLSKKAQVFRPSPDNIAKKFPQMPASSRYLINNTLYTWNIEK
ncbi:MAG: hypothetical protein LBF59_01410 [Prevotellaceae bacterium]|jgi:hypothetical protein|nr:hypothetical protein [Prevotellaceae bacterium]